MAKASLTLIQPARSPERQRLADAIAERDRREALVKAKRDEKLNASRSRDALWGRQADLQGQLNRLERGADLVERREALLRGETIAVAEDPAIVRQQLADLENEKARSDKAIAEIDTDLQLLEMPCLLARMEVDEATSAVLGIDPSRAAILAELKRLQPLVYQLRRAANGAFRADDVEYGFSPSEAARAPCLWQTARDRLASDPDARLPMPEDVFAEPMTRPAA